MSKTEWTDPNAPVPDNSPDLFRFFRSENGQPALKWSIYIPSRIVPLPKQALALSMCKARELIYGGAAGGGKSEFLLMAALQYADMPAYSALIIRKHLKDLQAADALLSRCMKWMAPYFGQGVVDPATGLTYSVRYIPHLHAFEFDTYYCDGTPGPPSRLQFGYIGEGTAEDQHQGSANQFVGIDEAGQHVLRDVTWFYSRQRYSTDQVCPVHGDDEEAMQDDCKYCMVTKLTPIRMRLTANPGGVGHEWIKKRYDIRPIEDLRDGRIRDPDKTVQYRGFNPDKPFIPSYWYDNRHTGKNYGNDLGELIDLDKAQLRDGDWDASPDSRFQRSWAKYYETHRDSFQIIVRDGKGNALQKKTWKLQDLYLFTTIDPAATAKEGPGDAQIFRQGEPSSTVISTWGITPEERFLFWLDCVIFSIEIPDVIAELQAAYLKWRPNEIICETNGPGIGVYQPARRLGLPMVPNFKVRDKVANATQAIIRMSQGRIFLPRHATWLDQVESQVFSWFGHPHQADDIVDTLSDAARHIAEVTNVWYEREEALTEELGDIPEPYPYSFPPEDDYDPQFSDLII